MGVDAMSACSSWKYTNVTPAVFRALQATGQKQGFSIPSRPSGSFTIQVAGVKVSFQYAWVEHSRTLTLTCTSKPMLLGCGTIKGYADKIVVQSGGKVS
jgi:hypothetical protein